MSNVLPFPHAIHVIPFAEEDGPFGVILERGKREIELAIGLNPGPALARAFEESRRHQAPLAPYIAQMVRDFGIRGLPC